jgi:hypothetical protein
LFSVLHEGDHQRAERHVEGVVAPRQRLGHALSDISSTVSFLARGDELRRRVDGGDVVGANPADELCREAAGPTADVDDSHAGGNAGRLGKGGGQAARVAAHEAVVLLGGGAELHG